MVKLLIVDANHWIWKKLRTLHESSMHRVKYVPNKPQALRLLPKSDFGLVLSDRHIAEPNGYEFLREIKRVAPDALIILVSEEDAGSRQASNTLLSRIRDYIAPIQTPAKIHQLIERALKLQRAQFGTHFFRDAVEDSLLLESRNLAMRPLLENARRAAASNGTHFSRAKEALARLCSRSKCTFGVLGARNASSVSTAPRFPYSV